MQVPLLVVPLIMALAMLTTAAPLGAAEHEHKEQGWRVEYPDEWDSQPGVDDKTTTFSAPSDDTLDIFRESFAVSVQPQPQPVPLSAAVDEVKKQMEAVGAELKEETKENITLGGHKAVRLVWSLNLGGLDLRLAQLITSVKDHVYLVTFTVEHGMEQRYEAAGHAMFNSFTITY